MAINKYLNFGGVTVGSYIGTTFTGGTDFAFNDGSGIDVSKTLFPSPAARFGSFSYSFDATHSVPGLTANALYKVIIDLCSDGTKHNNVDLNGTRVINDYAPIAGGNIYKGYSEVFEAVANSSGQITLRILGDGASAAIINAAAFIEIVAPQAGIGRIYPL